MIFVQSFKIIISVAIGILSTLTSLMYTAEGDGFPIPPRSNKTLFYIQRSTNANTIMYEANIENKNIDEDDPVSVYWIRYAEKGQRRKLNYIERVMAYGVTCKPTANHSFILHFNASSSKEVLVLLDSKGVAHARMSINKKNSTLEKIFVMVTDKSFIPKVDYVEFFGTDVTTGEKTYEKMMI